MGRDSNGADSSSNVFIGFSNLVKLKEAHARLIQQNSRDEPSPEFLDAIEGFLIRAKATGRLLDREDDRVAAQSIIDYWITVLLRGRRAVAETGLAEFAAPFAKRSIREEDAGEYLQAERAAMRNRLRLSAAAAQWNETHRDPGLLWGGAELPQAASYPDLTPLENEFLVAGLAHERHTAKVHRILIGIAVISFLTCIAMLIIGLWIKAKTAQVQARNAKHAYAQELVERADVQMHDGDVPGAILWLTEALQADIAAGKPDNVHRIRIGAAISQLPRLRRLLLEEDKGFVFTTAELSKDGQFILSVANTPEKTTGAVRIWKVDGGEKYLDIPSPAGPVNHATFGLNGQVLVATGRPEGGKGGAELWNLVDRRKAVLSDVKVPVLYAAFSADGNRVALVCEDVPKGPSSIVVKDVRTGQSIREPLRSKGIVKQLTFHPTDSNYIAASGADGEKGFTQLWNLQRTDPLTLLVHSFPVNRMEFDPEGNRIAVGTGTPSREGGKAEVWQIWTGVQVFEGNHARQVVSVHFSPDARRIISAGYDGSARIWNASTGILLLDLKHESSVLDAAYSPDGRYVITGSRDQTARIWRAKSGELSVRPLYHGHTVLFSRFSPDGQHLFTQTVNAIRMWDMATGESVLTPLNTASNEWKTIISNDGAAIAAISLLDTPPKLAMCTLNDRKWQKQPLSGKEAEQAFFSDDASLVLLSSGDEFTIWDTRKRQQLGAPFQHRGPVTYARFSPDGKYVLAASGQRGATAGLTQIWEVATGKAVGKSLTPHGTVVHAAFHDRYVATASGTLTPPSGEARIWDIHSGEPLTERLGHTEGVCYVGFNPHDSSMLVTGSLDDSAKVWTINPVTRAVQMYPLIEHTADLILVKFSPDGRFIVTGSYDRQAILWKVERDKNGSILLKRGPILVHDSWVNDANFSNDGRLLVTASADQTARVWEADTGAFVSALKHEGEVTKAQFGPGGSTVVTLSVYNPPENLSRSTLALVQSRVGSREIGNSSSQLGRYAVVTPQEWKLPAAAESLDELRTFAQLMRARTISEGHSLARLDHAQLREHWTKLASSFLQRATEGSTHESHWQALESSEASGYWFAAKWHIDRLIQANPNDVELLTRRADIFEHLNRWADAVADYTKVESLQPSFKILHARARAYAQLENWEKTIADTTAALFFAIEPRQKRDTLMVRAEAYAARRDWQSAEADLNSAIDLEPQRLSPYQRLAVIRLKQNDISGYQKLCKKMRDRFLSEQAFASMISWTSSLHEDSGANPSDLVEHARLALKDPPPKIYFFLNTLGATLYRAGRFEEAIEALNQSCIAYQEAAGGAQAFGEGDDIETPMAEGRPIDWILLAMAHYKLGNSKEASKCYNKAIESLQKSKIKDPRGMWHILEFEILYDEATRLLEPGRTQGGGESNPEP